MIMNQYGDIKVPYHIVRYNNYIKFTNIQSHFIHPLIQINKQLKCVMFTMRKNEIPFYDYLEPSIVKAYHSNSLVKPFWNKKIQQLSDKLFLPSHDNLYQIKNKIKTFNKDEIEIENKKLKTKNKFSKEFTLKKINEKDITSFDVKEFTLSKKLSKFPLVIEKLSRDLKPHNLCNYAYDLAKTFNDFYENCDVLKSEEKKQRILLVLAFKQVMENCLNILGIPIIEEM